MNDYLDRLYLRLNPTTAQTEQAYTSLYTFPAALDFFLACWRSLQKYPLARFYRATSLAQLTTDCESLLGFRARLSALADTVAQFNPERPVGITPESWKPLKSLQRLDAALATILDQPGHERATAAIGVLRDIVKMRNFGQHSGAEHEELRVFRKLGILYPIVDWQSTWAAVTDIAAGALDVLREEIQLLLDTPDE